MADLLLVKGIGLDLELLNHAMETPQSYNAPGLYYGDLRGLPLGAYSGALGPAL